MPNRQTFYGQVLRTVFEMYEHTKNVNEYYFGEIGVEWSLRKLLRRFIWHDRIHAKAMYRMAIKTFGVDAVPNIFQFVI